MTISTLIFSVTVAALSFGLCLLLVVQFTWQMATIRAQRHLMQQMGTPGHQFGMLVGQVLDHTKIMEKLSALSNPSTPDRGRAVPDGAAQAQREIEDDLARGEANLAASRGTEGQGASAQGGQPDPQRDAETRRRGQTREEGKG